MNTREKIVDPQAIRGRGVTLVTAYFDPLLAWHAERLAQLRAGSHALAACVLPLAKSLLPQGARAEMAASLRVIDYVLIPPGSDPNDAEEFIRSLQPTCIVRLEDEDLRRRAELMADVRSGKTVSRILIVRLGAMGDIIHTLPAAASLRASFPDARIAWVVEPQWAPLLEGNPSIDRIVMFRRDAGGLLQSLRDLRLERYDLAIDFQGLMKSAVVGRLARPKRLLGFRRGIARERMATLFYTDGIDSRSTHVVEMRLDLAEAAAASKRVRAFPLPEGRPEGALPKGEFVLASPLAGWRSKQWPIEHYRALAGRLRGDLGIPLVLNGPPAALRELSSVPGALPHISGVAGLIHATRCASAVVGVDSGPLHLAAALDKPGIAIYGPTDPARNGPYCDTLQVLRAPGAATTYKRGGEPDLAMWQVRPELVFDALKAACLA